MLKAAGFKAVKDGKMQVILLCQGSMSVAGRDGNCNSSDSSGKTPNALSQSCNSSGHLARWFCSPIPSPGSAVGKLNLPEPFLCCFLLQLLLTFLSPWATWRSRLGTV